MDFRDTTWKFREKLPEYDEFLETTMREYRCPREEAHELWVMFWAGGFRVWENDLHSVRENRENPDHIVLSISNQDGSARHDWRELQEIKNTLVGPECEAVELYPAESRKRDSGNVFHLFVLREGRFPFGASDRRVSNHPPSGFSQRPLSE